MKAKDSYHVVDTTYLGEENLKQEVTGVLRNVIILLAMYSADLYHSDKAVKIYMSMDELHINHLEMREDSKHSETQWGQTLGLGGFWQLTDYNVCIQTI